MFFIQNKDRYFKTINDVKNEKWYVDGMPIVVDTLVDSHHGVYMDEIFVEEYFHEKLEEFRSLDFEGKDIMVNELMDKLSDIASEELDDNRFYVSVLEGDGSICLMYEED